MMLGHEMEMMEMMMVMGVVLKEIACERWHGKVIGIFLGEYLTET